jgi:4a-hydroxytetrahydrobiopterin dehydratase
MPLLSDIELHSRLASLPGWAIANGAIVKTYTVRSFAYGVLFIGAIAQLAEAAGHHPDLRLHNYKQVTVELVTHSDGGLTAKDLDLAAQIEALPHKPPPKD